MKSDFVEREVLNHVFKLLMPQNRLVLECCLFTGLRVGDVLALKTAELAQSMVIQEQKTDKTREVELSTALLRRMKDIAGPTWVFKGRFNNGKHRSYSAVYKDLQKAAKALRAPAVVQRGQRLSPHTMRKVFAVDIYKETGSLEEVGRALNHNERGREVTMLYALADVITARELGAALIGREKRAARRAGSPPR